MIVAYYFLFRTEILFFFHARAAAAAVSAAMEAERIADEVRKAHAATASIAAAKLLERSDARELVMTFRELENDVRDQMERDDMFYALAKDLRALEKLPLDSAGLRCDIVFQQTVRLRVLSVLSLTADPCLQC